MTVASHFPGPQAVKRRKLYSSVTSANRLASSLAGCSRLARSYSSRDEPKRLAEVCFAGVFGIVALLHRPPRLVRRPSSTLPCELRYSWLTTVASPVRTSSCRRSRCRYVAAPTLILPSGRRSSLAEALFIAPSNRSGSLPAVVGPLCADPAPAGANRVCAAQAHQPGAGANRATPALTSVLDDVSPHCTTLTQVLLKLVVLPLLLRRPKGEIYLKVEKQVCRGSLPGSRALNASGCACK